MNRRSITARVPAAARPVHSASSNESTPFVEAGEAFARLAGLESPAPVGGAPPATAEADVERVAVAVIGGGQAGLSVGYHLRRLGVPFVILDADANTGDAWRHRWDSLRLFTPAAFDGLDGMPFPAHGDAFPTKDEMADFLAEYARRFSLPVRHGSRVERLSRSGERYRLRVNGKDLVADQVVVAMSQYQTPSVPRFAGELSTSIRQMHSIEYRHPGQLQPGDVLLVGAGNTGSELAKELSRTGRTVWMSGRNVGQLPFRVEGFLGRTLLSRLVLRFVFRHVLTTDTPMGRRMRPQVLAQGGPLIRVKDYELDALGVKRVPRVAGVENGRPRLEDGRIPDVANVIWCTGFRHTFDWIDAGLVDPHGEPRHRRGVVADAPGLYFVGLTFLYSMSSSMVHGVGRDARYVAEHAAARRANGMHAPGAGAFRQATPAIAAR